MGNSNVSQDKKSPILIDNSTLSMRNMKESDIPRVKEIVEFYLTESRKTGKEYKYNYSVEQIPYTLVIMDSSSDEDKEEMKEDDDESQKLISLTSSRALLRKKEEGQVIGFLQYYMKTRSDEELKEIEKAAEKGWLKAKNLPEDVPIMSAIFIAASHQHKRIEIYDKVIDKMKQFLKVYKKKNDKLGICSVMDCEFSTGVSKVGRVKNMTEFIPSLEKNNFKVLHINKEETYHRFRCLL
jgi:hypothetical protein